MAKKKQNEMRKKNWNEIMRKPHFARKQGGSLSENNTVVDQSLWGIMFFSDSTMSPQISVRVIKTSISEEFSTSPSRSRKLQKWDIGVIEYGRTSTQEYAFDICRLPVCVTWHTAPTDSRQISRNDRQLWRISRCRGFLRRVRKLFLSVSPCRHCEYVLANRCRREVNSKSVGINKRHDIFMWKTQK